MRAWAKSKQYNQAGFTILELVVIIGVIFIISVFAVISYLNIAHQASALVLKTDLKNVSTSLEIYKNLNSAYPLALNQLNNGDGPTKSNGTVFQYTVVDKEYYLSASSISMAYHISSNVGFIEEGVWSGHTPPVSAVTV